MRKLWFGIFLLSFLGFGLVGAQTDLELNPVTFDGATLSPDDPLPVDPALRTGMLDNGLSYYIRQNTEPRNRAELALVINAGSLQEDDDQQGVAHFLEHMLFNGTENFEGQELVSYLERIGMEFGPDVNAYTSFEETVYTLTIPLDDEETVQTAFQILSEWAARATLEAEEIEAERGVIVEEERLRDQNVNGRLRDQILPALFGDSRYAERLPIGDMDVVRSAPREAFTRFYDSWYRPDLMAVIAVGDFDVDVFEGYIRDAFSPLENPATEVSRGDYDVPEHDDTRYLITADPEFPVTYVEIDLKRPSQTTQTVGDYAKDLASSLFSSMLNTRLTERGREADTPFLQASVSGSGLTRDVETIELGVVTDDGQALAGLEALLEEVERARRFGFTESEFDRAKENLLSILERNAKEQEDISSAAFINFLTSTFLEGSVLTTNEADFALAEEIVPQLGLEDINAFTEELLATDNRVVLVLAPEKAGLELPNQTEVAAVISDAQAHELDPYEDAETAESLIETPPEPAAVTGETYLEDLDVTLLALENGVRVVVKTTDFTASEVLMSAVSYGGASLVSDEDYPEATLISSVISDSGVGPFDRNELSRLLTGKNVSFNVSIGDLTEDFSGYADSDDLETLFQLIYLYATQPRRDEVAFARTQDQLRASLRNRDSQPQAAFSDALNTALYGDAPRYTPLTLAEVDALDYARAFDIYQERFADMSDFVFTFVGDVTVDDIRELALRYLGTLPAAGNGETFADVEPDLPGEVVTNVVYKGQEEQSLVQLRFFGELNPTRDERLKLLLLDNILNIRMTQELREELGGVYSPSVFSSVSQNPDPSYALGLQFSADPGRVDELVSASFEVFMDIRVNGPDEDTFAKAKEQLRRNYEEGFEQNSFWRSILEYYLALSPDESPQELLNYEAELDELTLQDLRETAQTYIQSDRYAGVVLYPADYALMVE